MLTTIAQILRHPLAGTILTCSVTIIILFFATRGKRESSLIYRIKKLEMNSRQKTDCMTFRGRIGIESDGHSKKLTKIEKCLIYLVQQAGGKPEDLGLFD